MMKSLSITTLIFLILLMVSGCKYREGTHEVKVPGSFAVDIPHYFSKTNKLAPGMPLQYRNRFKTVYLVGREDPKMSDKDSLERYSEQVIEGFKQQIPECKVEKMNPPTFENMKAEYHKLVGTLDKEKVVYYLLTVEGKSGFYQVCTWVLAKRHDSYGEDLQKIISSFREI